MHTLILPTGEKIEYELNIKKVKNINLRVHRDGRISVSANSRVPLSVIEEFIDEKATLIIKAQKKFKSVENNSKTCLDTVKILGRDYPVFIKEGNSTHAVLKDGVVILTLKNDDIKNRENALNRLYTRVCLAVIPQVCERIFLSRYANANIEYPEIKFRKMKSRWGSCYSATGIINFNTRLACVPLSCIELVVAHELAHLVHPNHSSEFYSELRAIMPDYKKRKELLSTHHIM